MTNEILIEETAVNQHYSSDIIKYRIILYLAILSFFLAIVGVFYVIDFVNIKNVNVFLTIMFNLIPTFIFVTAGILLLKLKNRFCVDYDYIFVSGSLRISQVINNKNRKPIIKFNTSSIEKIGPYESKIYNSYIKNVSVKTTFFTSNSQPIEGKSFYYIVANVNSQKNLIIMECTRSLIINILKFSNMSVRDEELKWFI